MWSQGPGSGRLVSGGVGAIAPRNRKRRSHSSEFKARITFEALKGIKPIRQIDPSNRLGVRESPDPGFSVEEETPGEHWRGDLEPGAKLG